MRARVSVCFLFCGVFFNAAHLAAASPAAEAKVSAHNGDIFFRSGGVDKKLTESGRDASPLLSPDSRWVVFVRSIPGKVISTGSGEVPAAELWQIGSDGKEATLLVKPRESSDPKVCIAGFEDLQFSSDGRLVYFVSAAFAVSGAVHVVDTTKGKERFLMAGSGIEVMHSGEYKDCLLIAQHRYFIGGGAFDWWWLFRPNGTEIGPVGEDTSNFKDLYRKE